MSHSNNLSRRGFIGKGAAATAAGAAVPYFVSAKALGRDGQPGANEKINLGLIGCGGMGRGNLGNTAKHPDIVKTLEAQMQAHIRKRTKATGQDNPMHNQPHWHSNQDVEYFESSQHAYDTLHIGDAGTAKRLQAGKKR